MLAKLAQEAVKEYVKNGETVEPGVVLDESSKFFDRKAGTFVTLKKNGDLRACIGTFSPTQANVAEEVIHNAIGAASRDYRFGAVSEDELSNLSYEV
ncbi:MAG: AMMECR1 domain-containing protein, partial [Candidatus Paceibacterota bacterium]